MVRAVLPALLLAALMKALFTGAMVGEAEKTAQFYGQHGLQPMAPCNGTIPIVINPAVGARGYTYFGAGCIERIELGVADVHLLAHEVGHVYTARYFSTYGWPVEAMAEGLATMYTCRGTYAFRFFDTYYRYPPWSRPQEDWYYYGGLYTAWLARTDNWTAVATADPKWLYHQFLLLWTSKPAVVCGREFRPPVKDHVRWAGFPLVLDLQDYVEYWILDLPREGEVKVEYGGLSNLPLGTWLYTSNASVLAVFVGPGRAVVYWRPLATATVTTTAWTTVTSWATVTSTAWATVSTTAWTTVTSWATVTSTAWATVTSWATVSTTVWATVTSTAWATTTERVVEYRPLDMATLAAVALACLAICLLSCRRLGWSVVGSTGGSELSVQMGGS